MIVYEPSFWGLPLLWRVYGSAFPRALLFGGITAGGTALLYYTGDTQAKMSVSK